MGGDTTPNRRSEYEEKLLEDIKDKYEATKGILIWGKTSGGDYVAVMVDADGKLETS